MTGHKSIARVAVSAAGYGFDQPFSYRIPPALAGQVVPGVRVSVPFSRANRRVEGLVLALCEEGGPETLKAVEAVLDEAPVLTAEQISLALWMRERFFCTVYDAVKAMLPVGLWYQISSVYRISEGIDRDRAFEAAGRSKAEASVLEVLFAHEGACELRDIERAFEPPADPSRALSSLVKKGIIETNGQEKRRVKDKTVSFAALTVPAEEALEQAGRRGRRAPAQAGVLELLCTAGPTAIREISYFTGASQATVKSLTKAGLVEIFQKEVFRRPAYRSGSPEPMPVLNEEQETALAGILALTKEEKARAALLFGVTGSGKTAVYVRLIDALLQEGKSSIFLVPEIALTPQMLQTFSAYFGDQIAVLHSSLAIGERYDEWKRVKSGAARVIIGTRSAVFAPVPDLGAIIIDEEQEDTYKSENAPRYHARDVAKRRCQKSGALLLLGSATPDIESRYLAETGKYAYFVLPERYNNLDLPRVAIVDMKREFRQENGGSISSVLRNELQKNLEAGEQSILFLNRRGAVRLIACGDCGYIYACPHCSVSLTYHSANKRLMCHYCGYSRGRDAQCPDCGGILREDGAGTQKVQEELEGLFPGTEILRMDTDSISPTASHQEILDRFRDERIPILVGTQMVTKGLNFENVTLVGVISADQSLYSGDYRSAERTFSLITQVVGRSGRGDRPGRAVIQTFTPKNSTILQAAGQDYERFYASEIALRELSYTPPFSQIISFNAAGLEESAVLRCLADVLGILKAELRDRPDVRLLGPAPPGVLRVSDRYRYRLLICAQADRALRELVSRLLIYCGKEKKFKGVSVFADAGPAQ